jgi:hypothetical protein
MIQSLRAFGYDLTTAIADLIDNSLSSGARNVWLRFHWDGEDSWISVRDDGRGMSEETLTNAMRPGSQNPLEPRQPNDLGRFGLGLKTASFSQCKRLIVRSKTKNALASTRCWDLDFVAECMNWRLLKRIDRASEERLTDFDGQSHGTIVLWEVMDRLVAGNQVENRAQQDRFYQRAEQVSEHVAMVFHRFLERPKGPALWVNGEKVAPWNPFIPKESATQELPLTPIRFNGGVVSVYPYVLPHQSRISSKVFSRAGGSRGWNDLQGFYVYRDCRMLVAGDWLGLGFQKEEHCKLARIQLDISNSMDMDWQIDVKKSKARPPSQLRDELRRIARLTRSEAMDVYRSRGRVLAKSRSEQVSFLWNVIRRNGHNYYAISRQHPAVVAITELCSGKGASYLNALLRLIEETLPTKSASASKAKPVEEKPMHAPDVAQLAEISRSIYAALIATGKPKSLALEMMANMEPFNSFPELVASLEENGDSDDS